MNHVKNVSMLCLLAITLVGCGTNTENNKQTTQGIHDNQMEPTEYGTRTNTAEEGYVWDDAKKKIDAIKDVKSSHVVAVGHDAFVAVVLENENHEEPPKELKKKISDEVMNEDSEINKVYVSSNPEFFDHMENYGERLHAGESFSGLYDEFKGMSKRTFPESYSK